MSDDINNIMEKYHEACKALESRGFDPHNMQNGIKNTETTPKYDPCRKFRKGDRVRIVEYKGRNGTSAHPTGAVVTVDKDEEDCEWVFLKADDEHKLDVIDPAYLELVSPVEELELYYIEESTGEITLLNKQDPIFHKSWRYSAVSAGIIALTEAEAERDRLNAEYRKELE